MQRAALIGKVRERNPTTICRFRLSMVNHEGVSPRCQLNEENKLGEPRRSIATVSLNEENKLGMELTAFHPQPLNGRFL